MIEIKLLALFAACLAAVLINGTVMIKLYSDSNMENFPVLIVSLTPDAETPELMVRSCIYRVAESCPETIVAAVDFGAGSESLQIFEKLMERSCRYRIMDFENCEDNIRSILKNTE